MGKKLSIFCGTPSYMSPEIVNKQEYLGPQADVWALGVLLYVMLVAIYPFMGAIDRELNWRIARWKPTVPDFISRSGRALIQRMLLVDPLKRPKVEEVEAKK